MTGHRLGLPLRLALGAVDPALVPPAVGRRAPGATGDQALPPQASALAAVLAGDVCRLACLPLLSSFFRPFARVRWLVASGFLGPLVVDVAHTTACGAVVDLKPAVVADFEGLAVVHVATGAASVDAALCTAPVAGPRTTLDDSLIRRRGVHFVKGSDAGHDARS